MFRMKRKLTEMDKMGKKVTVGLVGAGKMGKGLVNQMSRIRGMRPSIICDEKPDKAKEALISAGVSENDIIITDKIDRATKALQHDLFVVTGDYRLTYEVPQIQGVIDATGNPPFGAQLALESIQAHKDIIMLNVECDAVVGPILYNYAKRNNVIYTGSAGDEPGAIMQLADFAAGVGFKILAVGKGKNNPLNYYVTEDDVREEALAKGLYPKMLTAFVDGTNTMIELTSVANALGFTPDVLGGHGIETSIDKICDAFMLKEQGGILNNYNIVDYCFGIAPGVFVIVTHDADEVHDLMKYVSMGKGPNYVLYRPYHLTSLETPLSVYDAIVESEPTIYPAAGQVSDTVTVAKRDIKKGQIIEGIGGKDVFGKITSHKRQKEKNLLPIALITKKTCALQDIKKDELITMDMVQLESDQIINQLRKKQDELGL